MSQTHSYTKINLRIKMQFPKFPEMLNLLTNMSY